MKELSGWQNFYVIVGSSAGALIGLQFVLISLIGRAADRPDGAQAGRTFSTPTVVHFTVVLLLAGAGVAPWREISSIAVVWGVAGVVGLLYEMNVVRRLSRQQAYKPEAEDWIFHALLPLAAYGILAVSSWSERTDPHDSLFAIAAAVLLLLVIGIHNAWDAATYHVFTVNARKNN